MPTQNITSRAVPGELDPSFATGGKFEVPTPTKAAVSLIADTDSLTVLMAAGQEFCLCRVNKDGKLDLDFDNRGWLKWRFEDGKTSTPWRALLQPDKKILLIGASYSSIPYGQPALTRFNPNGSPDLVFGRKILPVYPQPQETMSRVEGCLQSDDKILVCGAYSSNSESKTLLIRLLPDGTMDPDFGKGGIAELSHPLGTLLPARVAVQSSGRILVAGSLGNQGYVLGVGADGNLDTGFGDKGFALIEAQGPIPLRNLLVLKDGGLRCIGGSDSSGALLVGLDENGHPDKSFNDGKPVVTREFLGSWSTLCEQDDRKLLVSGQSGPGLEQVAARFSPQGVLDKTFGWSGFMYHPGGSADSVIQPGGRWITTAYMPGAPSAWLYGMFTETPTPD